MLNKKKVMVTRLIRVSYGDYQLLTIPPGMAIELPVKPVEQQRHRGTLSFADIVNRNKKSPQRNGQKGNKKKKQPTRSGSTGRVSTKPKRRRRRRPAAPPNLPSHVQVEESDNLRHQKEGKEESHQPVQWVRY